MLQIDELRKLPIEEKLRLVEALWDDIGASHVESAVPNWVKTEVRRRAEDILHAPTSTLTRAEVWNAVESCDG